MSLAPARQRVSLPSPSTSAERSVCQDTRVSQHTIRAGAQHSGGKMRAYHNTHYVPAHNISGTSCGRITTHITCRCTTKRSTPHTGKKRVSRRRASTYTLRTGAQHSARRETRVQRRYTSQIVTDGVQTHTTTFVHAGAWIVTLSVLCCVPAHTTTVVPAGA